MERFDFAFSSPLSWPLAFLGVTPWTAHVEVTDDEFAVRFGPWSLATPRSNVEGATLTGPYLPFKAIGPHVSLTDRGATFGTSWRRGVCVRFRRPVPAALPTGLLTHPAVTVTVADPERLVALLERTPVGVPGAGDELEPVLTTVVPRPAADAGIEIPVAQRPTTSSRRPARSTTTRPEQARARKRTPARVGAPAPQEHPTPADMPQHTETEKVPGVTPPADEGLPGPDSEL